MSKTMASVIANYMEHEGDRYDIGNSASNKVLGMDLQAVLSAAGFGLVADAKAEALARVEALAKGTENAPLEYAAAYLAKDIRAAVAAANGDGNG